MTKWLKKTNKLGNIDHINDILLQWHPLQVFCFHVEGSQNPENSALIKAVILMGAMLDQPPGCRQLWTPLWWTPAHNPRSPLPQLYTALHSGSRSSFDKPADVRRKLIWKVLEDSSRIWTCWWIASLLSRARNSSQQTVRRRVYLDSNHSFHARYLIRE